MHLHELLKTHAIRAALFAMSTGCGATTGSDHTKPPDDWRSRALALSREHLAVECDEVAPIELVDPEQPGAEYLACLKQADIAVRDERARLHEAAIRSCLADSSATEAACCFERLPTGRASAEGMQDRCNSECSDRSHRPQGRGMPNACRPHYVGPRESPPSRFYTEAVRAIERECIKNPLNASKCDALPSKWERTLCNAKCRPSRSQDDDAGVDDAD